MKNIIAVLALLVASMMVSDPAQAQAIPDSTLQKIFSIPADTSQIQVKWWWEAAKSKGMIRKVIRMDAATVAAQDSANKALVLARTRPAAPAASGSGRKRVVPHGYYTNQYLGPEIEAWGLARGITDRKEQAKAWAKAQRALMEGVPAAAPPPPAASGALAAAPTAVNSAAALLLAEAKAILAEAKAVADSTASLRKRMDYVAVDASAARSMAADAMDKIKDVAHLTATALGTPDPATGRKPSGDVKDAAKKALANY